MRDSELTNKSPWRGLKIEKSMSHPELGASCLKSSELVLLWSRHSDPGMSKIRQLTKSQSSSSVYFESGDPNQQATPNFCITGHVPTTESDQQAVDLNLETSVTPTNDPTVEAEGKKPNKVSISASNSPDSTWDLKPRSPTCPESPHSHNLLANEEEEDSDCDAAAKAFSSLVDMTMADSKPATFELGDSDSAPSVEHLEFESRFESGNLRKAIQVNDVTLYCTVHVLHKK